MKRIALYYRVSTDDQTTDPQRCELLDYCARRGWTNLKEYADKISGANFSRFGLNRLMADVRAHRVSAIVCVKMDRLGRSLPHLAQLVAELDCHGVALICTSQGIDTSNENPAGRLQMNILACVADFERSPIRERTKAGLAAATQSRCQARQATVQCGFSRTRPHRVLSKRDVRWRYCEACAAPGMLNWKGSRAG